MKKDKVDYELSTLSLYYPKVIYVIPIIAFIIA